MHPERNGVDAVAIQEKQQMVFSLFGQVDAIESVDHGHLDNLAGSALGFELLHDASGDFLFGRGGDDHFELKGLGIHLVQFQDGEHLLVFNRQAQQVNIGEHADDAGFASHVLKSIVAQVHPVYFWHCAIPLLAELQRVLAVIRVAGVRFFCEDFNKDQAKDKTAHVRPPGYPAGSARTDHKRAEAGEDLHDEPDAQVENGGQADETAKEEDGNEGDHARGREEHKVSAHDGSDGTAGAQGGNGQGRFEKVLQQRRADAAQHIEEQIAQRAKTVFDVIAKDHEKPHIADEVIPTAMQEHVGEERQQGDGVAEIYPGGGEGKGGNEQVRKISGGKILYHENQHVGDDDQPVHDRKAGGTLGISNRNHRSLFLEQYSSSVRSDK